MAELGFTVDHVVERALHLVDRPGRPAGEAK
jgi:hypothetical protein